MTAPEPLFDKNRLPAIPLTPRPQHFRGYAGLQNALNENMTAQIEVGTDTLLGSSTSKPLQSLRIGMVIPSDPLALTSSQDSLFRSLV